MKDGKIEYELIKLAKLEREVVGQLASGDAEGLEENLKHATEYLGTMEEILRRTESSQNADRTERLRNTVDGLRRVINKIGKIETVECDCCGDRVLKSATLSYNGEYLCVSCINVRME